jgi:hypothetical protein
LINSRPHGCEPAGTCTRARSSLPCMRPALPLSGRVSRLRLSDATTGRERSPLAVSRRQLLRRACARERSS